MTLVNFALLFPVVLAIHNIDEYVRYDDFIQAGYPSWLAKKLTRPIVRRAAVLLTLAAAVLVALTYFNRSDVLITISKVAIIALGLNGIGHCLLSLKNRAVLPGTLSAIVLVLPYSAIAVMMMLINSRETHPGLFCAMPRSGAVVAPIVIGSVLTVSYGFSWLCRPAQSQEIAVRVSRNGERSSAFGRVRIGLMGPI